MNGKIPAIFENLEPGAQLQLRSQGVRGKPWELGWHSSSMIGTFFPDAEEQQVTQDKHTITHSYSFITLLFAEITVE